MSSFAGLATAVAAVVAALTFGAGLAHLQTTPRLVGWNWDIALAYPDGSFPDGTSQAETRRVVQAALSEHHLDDTAMGTIWSPFFEGRDLQLGPDRIDVGG